MRARTCVACASLSPADVTTLLIVEEMLGAHHHHLMSCGCGAEWYDDRTASGFPSHRDVPPCDCPEDGRDIYTPSVMLAPRPESACRCGPAQLATRVRQRP